MSQSDDKSSIRPANPSSELPQRQHSGTKFRSDTSDSSSGKGSSSRHRSSRGTRSSSRRHSSRRSQDDREPIDWSRLTYLASLRLVQLCVAILIMATPWYYGSSPWIAQYYLAWGLMALAGSAVPFLIVSYLQKRTVSPPPLASWIFVLLAMIAFFQIQERYPLRDESGGPPSVLLQRWALGIDAAPPPVDQTQIQLKGFQSGELPCDIQQFDGRLLTRSVDPLHSTGALYALVLCALLLWVGGVCFSQKESLPWLFLILTVVGVLVGCVGIQGALSYKETNYLGLRVGSAYASFISKNAAGAYLNVSIAAALGLFTWTLAHLKRKTADIRYRVEEDNLFMKMKSTVEDFFADLSTPQIAALIAVVFLIVSLVMSQCRGAVVGGTVGLVSALLIANRGNRGEGGIVVVLLLMLASVGAMIAFNVDDNALTRIESLAELDLERESTIGRSYIWGIALQAMLFYGLFGSGLGTFQYAYLPFQNPSSAGWFYRAENIYLQCGVDLGFVGFVLMLVGLSSCALILTKKLSSDGNKKGFSAKFAGAYLLISLAVHGFVEHNLSIPGVFVPACLLLGATLTAVNRARKVSSRSRDKRRSSSEPQVFHASHVAYSLVLILFVFLTWNTSLSGLRNLAASEVMEKWVKEQNALPLEDQTKDRFSQLLDLWRLDAEELQKNPSALRLLADASIFEFRRAQVEKAPPNVQWRAVWRNTDPILLQIGLDRSQSLKDQESLIEVAGGKPAIELLNQASSLYSRAHLNAPMDWRLCWGRCLTALSCSREEMARLLSPVDRLGRHVSSYMINAALLFREQLDNQQLDQIWKQAMSVNPNASSAAARNLLAERKPEEISIDVFPQDSKVLISLARNVFTKVNYPDLHRQLWTRARELFNGNHLTPGEREVWLANAAYALSETDKEIEHLRAARRYLPLDVSVGIRLAGLYRQQGDLDTAQAIVSDMLIANPNNDELIRLQKQLRAAKITAPK